MKTIYLVLPSLFTLECVSAAFLKIDDFESGVGGWTVGSNTTFAAASDPGGGSNQVAALSLGTGGDAGNVFRSLGTTISSTSTAATIFYRFYLESTPLINGYNHFTGLSKESSPTDWADFTSYMGPRDESPIDVIARDEGNPGGSLQNVGTLTQGQWYNAWIVVNNLADTTDYYLNTGGDATGGDVVASGFSNRDASDRDIVSLLMKIGPNADDGLIVYFDDVYVDPLQENLTVIPEPSSIVLSLLGLLVAVLYRRRI